MNTERQILGSVILMILLLAGSMPAEVGLTGNIGFPAGRMKYSLNGGWYWRLGKIAGLHPEIRLHNSLALSSDDQIATTRQGINVSSLFLLLNYRLPLKADLLTAYLAPGWGAHSLYSFTISEGEVGLDSKWLQSSKAHLFFGGEVRLISGLFLFAEGRLTYHGDPLLDTGGVGLGWRF